LDETTMDSTIWTIGHSTRMIGAFLDLLAHFGLEAVADVRRFPNSRRQPQYGQVAFQATLAERGIAYQWFSTLGGRAPTIRVVHILDEHHTVVHHYTSPARIVHGRLSYASAETDRSV
jgi:uncharacterized protein (DUF488 family)